MDSWYLEYASLEKEAESPNIPPPLYMPAAYQDDQRDQCTR